MGEKGDSLLFLQPVEIDYLKDLEKHRVMLTEHSLLKLLGSVPLYNLKHQVKKFVSIDMHPWLVTLQRALESYISSEVCSFLLTVCNNASSLEAWPLHVLFFTCTLICSFNTSDAF